MRQIGDIVDAALASGAIASFLAYHAQTYKQLKTDRTKSWWENLRESLKSWSLLVVSTFVCLVIMLSSINFEDKRAYIQFAVSKGIAISSIWAYEVHIVYSKRSLFPFPDPSRPFSWWGTIMFFLGLATQVVFVAIGIFQLYENGPEFLWAFPIVSHIHMVAISTCIFRMCQKFPDEDYKRIRLWFCVSWAAFILSLILFVLAILDMWKHHAALQCTFCMSLVEVQARVDGKHKNLDQNRPSDGPEDDSQRREYELTEAISSDGPGDGPQRKDYELTVALPSDGLKGDSRGQYSESAGQMTTWPINRAPPPSPVFSTTADHSITREIRPSATGSLAREDELAKAIDAIQFLASQLPRERVGEVTNPMHPGTDNEAPVNSVQAGTLELPDSHAIFMSDGPRNPCLSLGDGLSRAADFRTVNYQPYDRQENHDEYIQKVKNVSGIGFRVLVPRKAMATDIV